MTRAARWKTYESDPDFRRWVARVRRKSLASGAEYPRKLVAALRDHFGDMSPAALVDLATRDRKRAEDMIDDMITNLEAARKPNGAPYAPGSIDNKTKAILSWLRFREVELKREFPMHARAVATTLDGSHGDKGRAPTRDELRLILHAATPRGRVVIAGIAYGDLRFACFGNIVGMDGIRLKDVPSLRIEGRRVTIDAPAKVVVRPELSKTHRGYYTLLCSEWVSYTIAYLEQRIAAGEILSLASALVATNPGAAKRGPRAGRDNGGVIATKNVEADVKDAIRKAGLELRPYDVKSYYETSMLIAENQKRISHRFTLFWGGRMGDISDHYSLHRHRLSPELEQEMVTAYKLAEPYLSAIAPPPLDLEGERAAIRQQVRAELVASRDAPQVVAHAFVSYLYDLRKSATDGSAEKMEGVIREFEGLGAELRREFDARKVASARKAKAASEA